MCICGEFKLVSKDFDLSKHDNLMNSIASREVTQKVHLQMKMFFSVTIDLQ